MDVINVKNTQAILNQLKVNQHLYQQLPIDDFEEHISRLFKRLKIQKKLFIKEINRVSNSDNSRSLKNTSELVEQLNENLQEQCNKTIREDDQYACLSVVIQSEEVLYELYNGLLFKNELDEISRMILKNQSNEIKRDIRGLKSIEEYA